MAQCIVFYIARHTGKYLPVYYNLAYITPLQRSAFLPNKLNN